MGMELRRNTAFWVLAGVLGALLFASAVPSPLYVVYQSEWDFSAITLTGVFAVYAIALLAALLVVGSLSDHIGRRPTLLAALLVEIVAMLLFAEASAVGWLFAARILQGLATGTAMGALSAALLDLQPGSKPWLGGLMGAVAPMAGLPGRPLGRTARGLRPGSDATRFLAARGSLPARAARGALDSGDGRRRRRLAPIARPRISVPRPMRGAFVAALPSLGAVWALGGLFLSLGASLTAGVLGAESHLAGTCRSS